MIKSLKYRWWFLFMVLLFLLLVAACTDVYSTGRATSNQSIAENREAAIRLRQIENPSKTYICWTSKKGYGTFPEMVYGVIIELGTWQEEDFILFDDGVVLHGLSLWRAPVIPIGIYVLITSPTIDWDLHVFSGLQLWGLPETCPSPRGGWSVDKLNQFLASWLKNANDPTPQD